MIILSFARICDEEGKLLLVQLQDGRWSLPGDAGRSLTEEEEHENSWGIIQRIVREQTGLLVMTGGRPEDALVGDPSQPWAVTSHGIRGSFYAHVFPYRVYGRSGEGACATRYVGPYELMELARQGDVPGGLVGGMSTGVTNDGRTVGQLQMGLYCFINSSPNPKFQEWASELIGKIAGEK